MEAVGVAVKAQLLEELAQMFPDDLSLYLPLGSCQARTEAYHNAVLYERYASLILDERPDGFWRTASVHDHADATRLATLVGRLERVMIDQRERQELR